MQNSLVKDVLGQSIIWILINTNENPYKRFTEGSTAEQLHTTGRQPAAWAQQMKKLIAAQRSYRNLNTFLTKNKCFWPVFTVTPRPQQTHEQTEQQRQTDGHAVTDTSQSPMRTSEPVGDCVSFGDHCRLWSFYKDVRTPCSRQAMLY